MNGRKVDYNQPPYNFDHSPIALGSIDQKPSNEIILSSHEVIIDNQTVTTLRNKIRGTYRPIGRVRI